MEKHLLGEDVQTVVVEFSWKQRRKTDQVGKGVQAVVVESWKQRRKTGQVDKCVQAVSWKQYK